MASSYPVRVEPKCEQTIFSRSNYQFWFATRWFGNFREVSRSEGESRLIPFKNGLGVRFGSDDSGTPTTPAPIIASNTGNSLIFISGNNLLTDGCMVRPITTQSPESVEGRVFIGVTVGRGVHRHLVEHAKGPAEVNDHLPDAD